MTTSLQPAYYICTYLHLRIDLYQQSTSESKHAIHRYSRPIHQIKIEHGSLVAGL
jgi:hypothetical protein